MMTAGACAPQQPLRHFHSLTFAQPLHCTYGKTAVEGRECRPDVAAKNASHPDSGCTMFVRPHARHRQSQLQSTVDTDE